MRGVVQDLIAQLNFFGIFLGLFSPCFTSSLAHSYSSSIHTLWEQHQCATSPTTLTCVSRACRSTVANTSRYGVPVVFITAHSGTFSAASQSNIRDIFSGGKRRTKTTESAIILSRLPRQLPRLASSCRGNCPDNLPRQASTFRIVSFRV